MPGDILSFSYAAIVAAGGIMGYAKAGSVASLGMGLVFGSILAYGAYSGNTFLSFGTSALLAGFMGMRFYNSGKFMPAGMVAAISTGMALKYLVTLMNSREQAKTN